MSGDPVIEDVDTEVGFADGSVQGAIAIDGCAADEVDVTTAGETAEGGRAVDDDRGHGILIANGITTEELQIADGLILATS